MADLSDFLKKKLQSDFELRQKEALSARPSLASLQEQVPASLALTGDRTNDYDDRDDGKQLEASPSHPPYIDMILEAIKVLKVPCYTCNSFKSFNNTLICSDEMSLQSSHIKTLSVAERANHE